MPTEPDDPVVSLSSVKIIGNIVWLLLAGLWLAIGYVIAGIVACIFIVTIPFGVQSFKLAAYCLWPFGRAVVDRPNADIALGLVANVIWFLVAGWWLTLAHLAAAVLLAITVIGLPFALVSVRMAGLALAPFGKQIVPAESVGPERAVVTA